MQVSTKILFEFAYRKYGIGAFNVFSAEQVQAVFKGAETSGAPVIIQITPVARNYVLAGTLESIIQKMQHLFPEVVFAIHLDHGNIEHCNDAIDSGYYSSVMIDLSHKSFKENMSKTSEIVKKAHEKNLAVEAELGVLKGIEDDISVEEKDASYTDPDQAFEFVNRTSCDSLAVAVGTSHGAYKFSGGEGLRLDILKKISAKLPGFPFVLHGASAVPYEEIERINKTGGKIASSASGISNHDILEAIKLGVCKINIATDMRLIWTRVHREFFSKTPELFDMVIPGSTYINELAAFVATKCESLGSSGKASEIQKMINKTN